MNTPWTWQRLYALQLTVVANAKCTVHSAWTEAQAPRRIVEGAWWRVRGYMHVVVYADATSCYVGHP